MAKRADEYRREGRDRGVEETQTALHGAIRDFLEQSQVGRRYLPKLGTVALGGNRVGSHEIKLLLADMVADLIKQQEWIAELNAKADRLHQFEAAQGALLSSIGAFLVIGSNIPRHAPRETILLKSLGGPAADKIQAIKAIREITSFGLKEAKDVVDAVAAGTPMTLRPIDGVDKQKWYENSTRVLRNLGCIFE